MTVVRGVWLVIAAAGLVGPAGCKGKPPDPPTVAPAWVDTLPARKPGMLVIEGMAETTTFVLDRTLDRFAVFYRPRDLVHSDTGGDAPDRVSLWFREIGPIRNHVAVLYVNRTREEVSNPDLKLPNERWEPRSPRRYTWTAEEYAIEGDRDGPYVGQALIGRHSGGWFWITEHYAPEMAEGMGPRLKAIYDSWIWTDTGESLAAVRPGTLR